jgi:hypothetical protein
MKRLVMIDGMAKLGGFEAKNDQRGLALRGSM